MPQPLRIGQAFYRQDPGAFRPCGGVSATGIHLAPPASGQCPLAAELDEGGGVGITVNPPTSARSDSPDRSDCAAKCIATNEDELAVSTDTAGPSRPSTYDTRPEATLRVNR